MKYDPQKHHRRSIRLPDYDYAHLGAYFVTICACQRESLFGAIVNGGMQLSPLGEIIQQEWFRSAQMRREIELHHDEFVIMPNHLHGIVWLVAAVDVGADGVHPDGVHPINIDPVTRGTPILYPGTGLVGADGIRPDDTHPGDVHPDGIHPVDVGADGIRPDRIRPGDQGARGAPLRRGGRSLASFVAGIKASVTSRARRELDAWNIWQRNYYEHIIRDEAGLIQIRAYIQTNLLRWDVDQLHPSAPPNRFDQEK